MSAPLNTKLTSIRKKALHLVDQNRKLLAKNESLEKEIVSLKKTVAEGQKLNDEFSNQIKIIKLARNIGQARPEEAGIKELKQKINEYIKEIDHCIAMLND